MFVYVFDTSLSQWVESESLFLHDIALLIDNNQKKVYLWFGPHSKEKERDEGTKFAEEMMNKYKMYELIILGDIVPLKIQSEIDILLGENSDPEKNKITRSISMRIFSILGIAGMFTMLVLLINNSRMLAWDMINNIFVINMWSYDDLFVVSVIIGLVISGIYLFQLIFAIISKKLFLIVCSIASLFMVLGTTLYLAQGIYIFEFLEGSLDETLYWIRRSDVLIHLLWIFILLIGSSTPQVLGIIAIRKQTEIKEKEIIDVDEMINQSKPTILRDKAIGLRPLQR